MFGVLLAYTALTGVLLAYNFTPTRAIVWGIVWAFTVFWLGRRELRRINR